MEDHFSIGDRNVQHGQHGQRIICMPVNSILLALAKRQYSILLSLARRQYSILLALARRQYSIKKLGHQRKKRKKMVSLMAT